MSRNPMAASLRNRHQRIVPAKRSLPYEDMWDELITDRVTALAVRFEQDIGG